jgi:hypothetical protein
MMTVGAPKENPFWLVVNPISMRRVFYADSGANPVRETQSHCRRRMGKLVETA